MKRKADGLMKAAAAVAASLLTLATCAAAAGSGAVGRAAPARPPYERQILVALEPQYVNRDAKLPTASWLRSLAPPRDADGGGIQAEPLRLPTSAAELSPFAGVFRLTLPKGADRAEWLSIIAQADGVRWCEAEPVRKTALIEERPLETDEPPGDPFYPQQWYLRRISAPAAWDITDGDTGVVIAVVDVGVDIDHGDLINRRWVNRLEAEGQAGADDDGNGFIDDVYGWDFFDGDPDPRPFGRDAHGTHVAGIACADRDNGYGIAGVAGRSRLMAVRTGVGTSIAYGYEGIIYAVSSGADVVNLSWGNETPSNIERITAAWARSQGALIVAAAGNRANGGAPYDHYPAGYPEVLAVAATDSGDWVPSFSNYGEWVDVCAPGAHILSTIPGGFGILKGTSMATPVVAGAAALIKAVHRDWGHEELKLQLSLSADPIDALNPHAAGMTGYGRLNCYRAVSSVGAGLWLDSFHFSDAVSGNGDGVIQPGERLEVAIRISNRLNRTATPSGMLTSEDNLIQITPQLFEFSAIASGESADNNAAPFRVRISPNAPVNRTIKLKLTLSGSGLLPQEFPLDLTVEAPYATHNNGGVALTISNFGALGYYDYRRGESVGESFRFPADGLPLLYHGGLMIGAWPGKVSDVAFGDSSRMRFDFRAVEPGLAISRSGGEMTAQTRFRDDGAEQPIGLEVMQTSTSFSMGDEARAVLVRYTIYNHSDAALDSVMPALFLDWDILQADDNICRYDFIQMAGWMEFAGGSAPIAGAALIDRPAAFHAALKRDNYSGRRWTDAEKWRMMDAGFAYASGVEPDDYWQVIGAGPITIARADSAIVSFALAAANTRSQFIESIAALRRRFGGAAASFPIPAPDKLALISIYPQPFNARAAASLVATEAGRLQWRMIDASGRRTPVGGEFYTPAGEFTFPIDGAGLPTGAYFLIVQSAASKTSARVFILR